MLIQNLFKLIDIFLALNDDNGALFPISGKSSKELYLIFDDKIKSGFRFNFLFNIFLKIFWLILLLIFSLEILIFFFFE